MLPHRKQEVIINTLPMTINQASSQASPSSSHVDAAVRIKRGSNLACLKCRAIKVKCWKVDSNDPRCARCNRLDLFCEFREHHRGKKLEKLIKDEEQSQYDSPESLREARDKLALCSSYPVNIPLGPLMGLPEVLEVERRRSQPSLASASLASPPTAGSDMSMVASSSNYMTTTSSREEGVRSSTISWQDACYLFQLFVTHLNPVAALLDPQLHTASYTRDQLPILFSTIMSVSSGFFRPEVHAQCRSAADAMLASADADRTCTVDHVQALIVQVIWCTLGDESRPRKLVKAIGLAYELGLPYGFERAAQGGAGRDPQQLRTQQRTWVQLCLLELSQQANTDSAWNRPQMIAAVDMPSAQQWYDSDPNGIGVNDTRLAFLLDLALGQNGYNQLAETTSGVALEHMLQRLEERQTSCSNSWMKQGSETILRYNTDQHTQNELDFLIFFSRFARARQVFMCATKCCALDANDKLAQSIQQTWFHTTTDLALTVLEKFVNKVMAKKLLRLSPQYMGVACFGAAQWLLSQEQCLALSIPKQTNPRIEEILGLLSQPEYYPDGSRIARSREVSGVLDLALRSIMRVDAPGTRSNEEKARGRVGAKKRRTSDESALRRLEASAGSTSSRSEGEGSERGTEWSPQTWNEGRTGSWTEDTPAFEGQRAYPWAPAGVHHRSTAPTSESSQSDTWSLSYSAPDLPRTGHPTSSPNAHHLQYLTTPIIQPGFSQMQNFGPVQATAAPSLLADSGDAQASGAVGSGGEAYYARLHQRQMHQHHANRSSSMPSSYMSPSQPVADYPLHYYSTQHLQQQHVLPQPTYPLQQQPQQQHVNHRQSQDDYRATSRSEQTLLDTDLHGLLSSFGDQSDLQWQQGQQNLDPKYDHTL